MFFKTINIHNIKNNETAMGSNVDHLYFTVLQPEIRHLRQLSYFDTVSCVLSSHDNLRRPPFCFINQIIWKQN